MDNRAGSTSAECPDENTLGQLVEAQLSGDRLRDLEAHLDQCPRCASLLADLAALLSPEVDQHRAAPSGRFRILSELGAGAHGVVHEAFDTKLRRRVALKRIRPDLSLVGESPIHGDARARLMREARLLAGLSHPNIVALYDVVSEGDELVLVQELVTGRSFATWLAEDTPSTSDIASAFVQAARGLHAAHLTGLVHRDVKPGNLLMGRDGRVRLTDFGLACTAEQTRGYLTEPSLTMTGATVGTPAYMAPEQFMGRAVDARSDQYSLAVALTDALVGERPLPGSTPEDLEEAAAQHQRPAPTPAVMQLLCRALEPRPGDRFPNLAEFADELERHNAPSSPTLRPVIATPRSESNLHARRSSVWFLGALMVGGATALLSIRTTNQVHVARTSTLKMHHSAKPLHHSAVGELAMSASSEDRSGSPPPSAAILTQPNASERRPATEPTLSKAAREDAALDKLMDAHRLRSSGKGAECIDTLQAVIRLDPRRAGQAGVQKEWAECEMLLGQCEEGRSRMRKLLRSSYDSSDDLESAVNSISVGQCKPEPRAKTPADERLEQDARALLAAAQTAAAESDVTRCRQLGADAMKLTRVGMPMEVSAPLSGAVQISNDCLIKAGDCTAARSRFVSQYRQLYPSIVSLGVDEKKVNELFSASYPSCAK